MFKKVLLFLLKPVVWLLLLLVIETTVINFVALNPVRIKANLAKQNVYPKIIAFAGDYFGGLMNKAPAGKSDIPPGEISPLLQESIDPKWLRHEAEKAIDNIFAYANGGTPTLTLAFDLKPVKQTLPDKLNGYFAKQYKELRECTPQEEKVLFEQNNKIDEITCRPSFLQSNLEFSQTKSGAGLNKLVFDLPDTYDMAPIVAQNQTKIEKYKADYLQYRKFYRLEVVTLTIVALILLLLHLPDWKKMFKTLAGLFLSVGFLILLAGIISKLISFSIKGSTGELAAALIAPLANFQLSVGFCLTALAVGFYIRSHFKNP